MQHLTKYIINRASQNVKESELKQTLTAITFYC